MRVIAEAGTYTPPDGGEPSDLNHWVVHLESEDLSLGTYSIPRAASMTRARTPRTRSTWCSWATRRW